jgi:hypothetical protein
MSNPEDLDKYLAPVADKVVASIMALAVQPGGAGPEGLLVDGGGIDGGSGTFFANAVTTCMRSGRWLRIVDGYIGCIVIRPDGSRRLARAVPDPLTQQKPQPPS